ncbi:hypothetical protein L226DRAFT_527592 [Lentinus tigrinus ALCF2SS1-7]|uniref:uncharacterized protein n=1 Tax=Lentinus tigrinus ALCF2SS1-7 TaxID=1328758 RepID=UPI0011660ABE|nr:hypothetical protein L226DRAFT_527592 [Lentinus tigrinus ALCF2SS1-7]
MSTLSSLPLCFLRADTGIQRQEMPPVFKGYSVASSSRFCSVPPLVALCDPPGLQCLTSSVKAYIDRAITRVLRDPVGHRDFARTIPDLTCVVSDSGNGTVEDVTFNSTAELAITDDLRIGQCWSVPRNRAQLGLRLSELMHPTHISIDHIPAEIAADIGQAPHTMILWGAVDSSTNEAHMGNITANFTIPAFVSCSAPQSITMAYVELCEV